MSIPEDFIKQLEQYSELSHREKQVFLEIFGRSKSRVQVTQELNISESNLSTCLTGIYKKFSVTGSGPVKESRLREYLSKRYTQQQPSGHSTTDEIDDYIDTLVQEIRNQIKPYIKEKCGTMRVLDMPKPIKLTGKQGIYTNVNILEEITGRRRLKVAELIQNCDHDDFERIGLTGVKQERVSGLEAVQRHSKLMVLGKPGAGKTTFLKYLAMQSIEGKFQADRVPLFITLKDFAESPKKLDILEFITQLLSKCGVNSTNVTVEKFLKQGKALVLLDGLDEVREEDTKRVLGQIREFSELFHSNQFVITCRIAAKEYIFESFTEVEMADFDEKQIAIFAHHWFNLTDPVKGERFIKKLKDNKPIKELASSPLLLTLLCLVFGDSGDFPANRSELYKEGLDVLLKKWDAKRNIERYQVYKKLSLQRKEDLLSQIAWTTFQQKDYFFKQKLVEEYIANFIRNLPNADTDSEALRLDSEVVLKSIEAQHGLLVARANGIYSFSHLTFHEYFAAREIVTNSAYETLIEHITEKRWREVFMLTAGMIPAGMTRKADDFLQLMKYKTDELISNDEQLQHFIRWVAKKSSLATVPFPPAEIRGVYLFLMNGLIQGKFPDFTELAEILAFDLALTSTSDTGFYKACNPGISSIGIPSLNFQIFINFEENTIRAYKRNSDNDYYNKIDFTLKYNLKPDLQTSLDNLKRKLPLEKEYSEDWDHWWRNNKVWNEELRLVMIKYCDIGHNWKFNDQQKTLLQQYYDASQLLINCLNNDCYVSLEVRKEIENTLLLPSQD